MYDIMLGLRLACFSSFLSSYSDNGLLECNLEGCRVFGVGGDGYSLRGKRIIDAALVYMA